MPTIKQREDVILRLIHGTYFLIDITDTYQDDSCSLYELNEIGAYIWDSIDGNKSVKDIAVKLSDATEDNTPYSQIEEDVAEFIEALSVLRFVEAA